MPTIEELRPHLARHGQEDALRFFDELDEAGRARLVGQLETVDLDLLDRLVAELVRGRPEPPVDASKARPYPVVRLADQTPERMAAPVRLGEEALAGGRVAAICVAGGQGTRLRFDGPKGTYPIGPVSHASLFQLHAERIAALERRHGAPIPLLVMTSPDNHEATAAFFAEHDGFGLRHVRLFTQGQMPAVDRETGELLLAAPDRLALSPDGHGGTLRALAAAGAGGRPSVLDEVGAMGVDTLYYFQVDNPLIRVADPAFLGLHLERDAEVSAKVVEKVDPREKVGAVVDVDGRAYVIEYSDLPDELAERRRPDGGLVLWAGSIANHVFSRSFIERVVSHADGAAPRLPFHRADKKVPFVDEDGELLTPDAPNAVKFEMFIFDTLPLAERCVVVETDRREFAPLKNAEGDDSPASVRAALSDRYACWLEAAGAHVARDADGRPSAPVEISPLVALGPADLAGRIRPGATIDAPLYLDAAIPPESVR